MEIDVKDGIIVARAEDEHSEGHILSGNIEDEINCGFFLPSERVSMKIEKGATKESESEDEEEEMDDTFFSILKMKCSCCFYATLQGRKAFQSDFLFSSSCSLLATN
jgi:hypothetical protein